MLKVMITTGVIKLEGQPGVISVVHAVLRQARNILKDEPTNR
jgi:hypothetical protein